jgi:hypothetical protein
VQARAAYEERARAESSNVAATARANSDVFFSRTRRRAVNHYIKRRNKQGLK